MTSPFLSREWMAEVDAIRASIPELKTPPAMASLKLNLNVVGGPDGDGEFHLVGAGGGLAIVNAHVENADATVTMPYDVAKAMFVDGNQQAAMQAFMGGQIKVDGDMTRLMALAQAGAAIDPAQQQFQERVKAATA